MNPESTATFATMCKNLESSAVALFRDYGVDVTPSSTDGAVPFENRSVAAVIGYASEQVRGALVVIAPASAVDSWGGGGDSNVDPCDVIGEFSNMLLGRLKVTLLRDGLTLLLSTPTAARGTAFVVAPSDGRSSWLALDAPEWRAKVRIDAVFEEGFSLSASGGEAPADAGDMMLF